MWRIAICVCSLLVAAPASAHGWGGRGFGFFPFFPFVFVPPPPVYYYPPPYYAPPPSPPPPVYRPPVYKDRAPLPRHESSDDKQWRKQIITRIEENGLTTLNDGECYIMDQQVEHWKIGDEVLVTNDRSELINQTRGNEGSKIEMIGEQPCE